MVEAIEHVINISLDYCLLEYVKLTLGMANISAGRNLLVSSSSIKFTLLRDLYLDIALFTTKKSAINKLIVSLSLKYFR